MLLISKKLTDSTPSRLWRVLAFGSRVQERRIPAYKPTVPSPNDWETGTKSAA